MRVVALFCQVILSQTGVSCPFPQTPTLGKKPEKWHNGFAMILPVLATLAMLTHSEGVGHRTKSSVVRTVAPGVELIQETTVAMEPGGPLVVTVLRVDPKVKGVRIEAALGGGTVWGTDPTLGREIPSKTVAQRHAVAGINASFFPFAGNPIGLHMEKGELITEPTLRRTAFMVSEEGQFHFGRFGYEGTVRVLGGDPRPLHGLNRKPGQGNELLLFSPIFAARTLKAANRVEAVLDIGSATLKPSAELTAKIVSVGTDGNTPLKVGTVVLSGGGASGEWLREQAKVGGSLQLKLALSPLDSLTTIDPTRIREAVTGAPRIVTNGHLSLKLQDEKVAESFSTTRHPRTAVGVTINGKLLFVTVDGRQPSLSRGASLKELATILLEYGAVDAVNLDGGGSSACSIRGAVVNSPSEGVERPVADSLLVFANEGVMPPSSAPIKLNGPSKPLHIGDSFTFSLPAGVEPEAAVWTCKGGIGFVSQEGVFRALRPGKGTVQLWRGSGSVSVSLTVAKGKTDLDNAAFVPKATLSQIDSLVTITVANSEGDRMGNEPVQVEIVGGKANKTSVNTNGRGEATVKVDWDTNATQRQIKLSSPNKRFQSVAIKF